MLSKPKKKVYVVLLWYLIISCSYSSITAGENSSKISPALALKIKEYDARELVPVIITLKGGDTALNIPGAGYIKKRYDLINAVSAQLSMEGIKKLETDPDVEKIYYDTLSYPLPMEEASKRLMAANTETIGSTYTNNVLNYTGRNVTIAILDTGIDYTHPDLGGCIGPTCKVRGGYDFANSDSNPMDDNGHGTHCAGIAAANGVIKGVAPDARLLAVKVCNTDGCLDSDTMSGIDWAVANGANVISLSLGTNRQPSAGNEPLQMLCDAAFRMGVTIVAAAGNEGPGTGTIADIAASRSVIAAGGDNDEGTADASDDIAPNFASRGPAPFGRFKPDIVAPSTRIYSTYLGGGYTTKDGTSMSAPHIAGAAALLIEYNRSLTPEKIKSLLIHSTESIAGHPFETGTGLVNVSRAILSRLDASINGKAIWEESIVPGMEGIASLKIKNLNSYPVNVSITAANLSDAKDENIMPSTRLLFPNEIVLGAGQEKTVPITFNTPTDASPGTYATVLRIKTDNDSMRIPITLTVPLFGKGIIHGSVNHDCSLKTQEGCGINPTGNVNQWGDWIFYELSNYNGTNLRVNLTWPGADSDLDLYLLGPDGGLYNYSGQADTSSEYLELSDLKYNEYWIAVYAFGIAPAKLEYSLDVSYASAIRLEPGTWQGVIPGSGQYVLNFTLINDGTPATNLEINAVMEKAIAGKTITGPLDHTNDGYYNFIWKKSTSGLILTGSRYVNATLSWNNPTKDINMYFLYKNGADWNITRYMSSRRNDLLGIGREEILGADIKYYLDTYSDIGIGASNPGSSQSYSLWLNFTGEASCDYARASPSIISSMTQNENRTLQLSINTDLLTAGNAYDLELIVKISGIEASRVPIRLTISSTTTTSTTTTTTTTSTTTSTSTTSIANASTTTIISSTTTTLACKLTGDDPPCGEVTLSEVVAFINEWAENEAALNDVIALINAWAQPQ